MKKKIFILLLVILLATGCGKKEINLKFEGNLMTEDYSKDSAKKEKVTYTDKKNNIEVVTTPNEEGKKFTAVINYKEREIYNIFSKLEFDNIKAYKRNDNMFIELHNSDNVNNINLLVMDLDGNVKRSKSSISSIVFYDDSFTVTEKLIPIEDESKLCKYYDKESYVSREITYDYETIESISIKEIKVGDICK